MNFKRSLWPLLFTAVCAVAQRDPVQVLARFGAVVREDASRIQGLPCVQTIERRYYSARLAGSPRSCDDLAAEKKRPAYRLELDRSDRLRLDVRAGPTHEIYSWPGADRVEDRDLWDIIGSGPVATSPFAMLALQVVQGDAVDFAFLGETDAAGRKLYEYSFRVPAEKSHYSIYVGRDAVATAWSGTILVDPETSDLVRLTTRTSELPRGASACELATDAAYGRERLRGREFLISRETRQRFVGRSGDEVESVVTFSSCREYRAESRLGFGAGPAGAPPQTPPAPSLDLPAGLRVQIGLDSIIDSATAAGGDRFTGRLSKPVVDGTKRVLVPDGSPVAGRLLKVAQRMSPPEVTIVLNVETVRIDGADAPFHVAGLQKPEWFWETLSSMSISVSGSHSESGVSGLRKTYEPFDGEYNILTFSGTRKILEPGFKTEWETVEQ